MKAVNLHRAERSYVNVMESLVAQEVGKQLQDVPARIRRYLKMEEVVTYALNRLPALYASSEKGWQYQRQMAKRDMHRKIQDAVRQAIVAVQVDPLRLSQPLSLSSDQETESVLQALRALFQVPDLNWETALTKLNGLQKNPLAIEQVAAQNAKTWQPDLQSSHIAWTHRRRRPANSQTPISSQPSEQHDEHPAGWDNVLYRL